MRVWSDRPPAEAIETPLQSPKVTVWCAMGAQGIIGPIFVQNETGATVTVTQGIYQQVLVNFKSELRRRCGDQLNVQWFQQDGAPPHTAKAALEWLKEHFSGRVVGKGADFA